MSFEATFILLEQDNKPKVHFINHDVLSGTDNNRWFEIKHNESLADQIELIMQNEKVAYELSSLELTDKVKTNFGASKTYKVIYNKEKPDHTELLAILRNS